MAKDQEGSMANGSSLRYIPCRVEPGMFRGEYLAFVDVGTVEDPSHTVRAQLLVDQREVAGLQGLPQRNSPVAGYLRVEVVDT
jgi:hypothetical protein